MNRRDFVKGSMASSLVVLTPVLASCTGGELSVTRVMSLIQTLRTASSLTSRGAQTPFQTLMHCSQSIDCAIDGYPDMKAPWLRKSIGKAAFHAFSLVSRMKHDLEAPIPGMAVPPADGDVQKALDKLEASFRNLQAAKVVKPHFFYGELTHAEMERAQILHFLNHLDGMTWTEG